MKTVGIIGGLDFIGCDITLKFLAENYQVKILNSSRPGMKKPLIKTGLKNGNWLKIYPVDFKSSEQLISLIYDCDILIHCGIPFKLILKTEKNPLFVPVIKDTGFLLKALNKAPKVSKIIFLSAPSDSYESFHGAISDSAHQNSIEAANGKSMLNKALYHSNKIISKTLEDISKKRIQIFFVAPVTVAGNSLSNNVNSVREGLRFLFQNNINHDKVFQNIIKRNLVETMLNVNEIPDKIFESINKPAEVKEESALLQG